MKALGGTTLIAVIVCVLFATTSPTVFSHCEIPCGIYGDQMRFDIMNEHIATIEKSIMQINELSSSSQKDYNQLVRWIANKEKHADDLSDVVTQYFMKQRIKPAQKDDGVAYEQYVNTLTLLHRLMVLSMKCKQTSDLSNIAKLRTLLNDFRLAYLGPGANQGQEHKH